MFRSHHRRTLLLTLATAAAFTTISSADHSWSNYHWARQGGELRLNVGDNVSQAWDAYLDEAIRDWNPSTVIELTEVAGGTKKNCRPTSGRIEACSGAYGNTGWLGIAQIWVQGSHITQAITKLNDTYFRFGPARTAASRSTSSISAADTR